MNQNQRFASIIVNGALEEMARVSGADISEILACMIATPDGAAAKRFREYVALGVKAVDRVGA